MFNSFSEPNAVWAKILCDAAAVGNWKPVATLCCPAGSAIVPVHSQQSQRL